MGAGRLLREAGGRGGELAQGGAVVEGLIADRGEVGGELQHG